MTTCDPAIRHECPEPHCGTCEHHSAALHCPSCVGKVRDALTQIEAMSARLLHEATVRGINSAAAALAGPAADPDIFGRRLALAIDNRLCECDPASDDVMHPLSCPYAAPYIADNRDEAHPLWVTGTWDMLVTQHLGHERTQRVTLSGAVSYLCANLTDLANDGDFPFDEMAREVRKCRAALEDALMDGVRHETGAPCMTCRTPLVRVWGATEALDGWKCHQCSENVSEAHYWMAVMAEAEDEQAKLHAEHVQKARWLTIPDLATRLGITVEAVKKRVQRADPKRRRGKDGRDEFRVSDLTDTPQASA